MRAGMTGHCSSEPHISLHKVETFIRGIIHSFVHHPCHTTQISNIKFSLGLGRTISERCEHNVQWVWWAASTYKYEDGEESEDVAQPAHVLAGGPGVPRHGALTAPSRHTSPSHWRGFTTCYLSTVYCSAQVINILDFSFRDCGLKQKARLDMYGQMARKENLR